MVAFYRATSGDDWSNPFVAVGAMVERHHCLFLSLDFGSLPEVSSFKLTFLSVGWTFLPGHWGGWRIWRFYGCRPYRSGRPATRQCHIVGSVLLQSQEVHSHPCVRVVPRMCQGEPVDGGRSLVSDNWHPEPGGREGSNACLVDLFVQSIASRDAREEECGDGRSGVNPTSKSPTKSPLLFPRRNDIYLRFSSSSETHTPSQRRRQLYDRAARRKCVTLSLHRRVQRTTSRLTGRGGHGQAERCRRLGQEKSKNHP